jgi:hypothetical protein
MHALGALAVEDGLLPDQGGLSLRRDLRTLGDQPASVADC